MTVKEKVEFTDYIDPIKPTSSKSDFVEKLRNMPIGKAIVVSGLTPKKVGAKTYYLSSRGEGSYRVSSLGDGRVQVERTK